VAGLRAQHDERFGERKLSWGEVTQ
jgi:hypothetical protein